MLEVQVKIVEDVSYGITEERTSDELSRDSTYQSHNVQGIRAVGKDDCFDLTVGFDIVDGKDYFLLFGTYDTGDSFGRDEGRISFVDLYQDRTVAEENAKRLGAQYRGNEYTARLVAENGKEYDFHVPWKGYFERLVSIEVQKVSAVYEYREDF